MTIIGFNFSKLFAQHRKAAKGDLKVGTNVRIDGVEKTSMSFDQQRSAVKISFTYTVSYDPDIGSIELAGDILFLQEQAVIQAILDEWTKRKALPKKLSAPLVSAIMQKCVIQALILTKDIGLPPPIPLPRVIPQAVKVVEPEKVAPLAASEKAVPSASKKKQ